MSTYGKDKAHTTMKHTLNIQHQRNRRRMLALTHRWREFEGGFQHSVASIHMASAVPVLVQQLHANGNLLASTARILLRQGEAEMCKKQQHKMAGSRHKRSRWWCVVVGIADREPDDTWAFRINVPLWVTIIGTEVRATAVES